MGFIVTTNPSPVFLKRQILLHNIEIFYTQNFDIRKNFG